MWYYVVFSRKSLVSGKNDDAYRNRICIIMRYEQKSERQLVTNNSKRKKPEKLSVFRLFGVPGAIRTRGVPLRRRTLYPAEVRGLIKFYALSAEP